MKCNANCPLINLFSLLMKYHQQFFFRLVFIKLLYFGDRLNGRDVLFKGHLPSHFRTCFPIPSSSMAPLNVTTAW